VFENRVLRKRGEVTGGWIRLHNEELHDLHCSSDVMWVIKSRRMSWMGRRRCMQDFDGETGRETTWDTQAQIGGEY
jgi:hypothetical protein